MTSNLRTLKEMHSNGGLYFHSNGRHYGKEPEVQDLREMSFVSKIGSNPFLLLLIC